MFIVCSFFFLPKGYPTTKAKTRVKPNTGRTEGKYTYMHVNSFASLNSMTTLRHDYDNC